jgi:phosphatidylserine decarboxylase
MPPIQFIDRESKENKTEDVYGQRAIEFLYGNKSALSKLVCTLISKITFFSVFYGFLQKTKSSKNKIRSFIKKYNIDTNEFLDPVDSFKSFNDFFIRKLKKEARPIASGSNVAIIPADGRYLFYEDVEKVDGFVVKGKKFDLKKLLQNETLANKFKDAGLVIARLCPLDYHRFHFPFDSFVHESQSIKGPLYSVNPLAIKQNIDIFTENKRSFTLLKTAGGKEVVFMEVGATSVGSIFQTFLPNHFVKKGDEKGYFSFGGSTLVLLFEKGSITFDNDLLNASKEHREIYCKFGQSMGLLH